MEGDGVHEGVGGVVGVHQDAPVAELMGPRIHVVADGVEDARGPALAHDEGQEGLVGDPSFVVLNHSPNAVPQLGLVGAASV